MSLRPRQKETKIILLDGRVVTRVVHSKVRFGLMENQIFCNTWRTVRKLPNPVRHGTNGIDITHQEVKN